MKQVIALIILALISAFGMASASAATCDHPIFYAQNVKHTKEVSVCAKGPNTLYYSFGKMHMQPELVVKATKDNATWAENHTSMIDLSIVNINNGNTRYSVSSGTNDEGNPFSDIVVYQNEKHLATITLDPKTVVNNISTLSESQIPETDEL